MDLKLNETAREIGYTLSEAIELAEGTLQLLEDAARQYGDGDMRYHALRALVAQIRAQVVGAADALETMADAHQKQL